MRDDKIREFLGVCWHEDLTPNFREIGNEAVKISPCQWVFLRHALIIAEKATREPTAPSHQSSAHFLAGIAAGLSNLEGNSEEKNLRSSEYSQKLEQKILSVQRSESVTYPNKTQQSPNKSYDKHPADSTSEGCSKSVAQPARPDQKGAA